MSTPSSGLSSILSSLGNFIAPDLGAEAAQAEQQLQLAFTALMGAQIILIAEGFVIIVILWKHLRK